MSDYRERLGDQLRNAAERELRPDFESAPERHGRRRPARRTVGVIVAALAVSGTAVAATRPWEPVLGDPDDPTTQDVDSPPPKQLRLLGVLRRPPTAADRDAATQATFQYVGPGSKNVHVKYIRRLGSSAPGRAVVLVPAQRFALQGDLPIDDALCVFYSEPKIDGGGKACFSTAELREGKAIASLGRDVYGLVPDGVATVSALFAGDSAVTAPVQDNFFVLRSPATSGDRLPQAVGWQSAAGESAGPPAP